MSNFSGTEYTQIYLKNGSILFQNGQSLKHLKIQQSNVITNKLI